MKVFSANAAEYNSEYRDSRIAHIKGGVSEEFLAFAQKFARDKVSNREEMEEWEFKDKKQQYLFEFDGGEACPPEVFDFVANVTGLPRDQITLCERHIKIYEDVANNNPPPHKDRVASQITVGIPLVVPDNSYIILYPDDHRTVNPFTSTALWRTSLDDKDLPENSLANIEPLKAHVQPGDVVFFEGNSIYHERVNPANTSLLYLKFNAMRLDPIGEDQSTLDQNKVSHDLLASKTDTELMDCRVEVSPRLENVRRLYTRLHWKEVIQANLVGHKEFTLCQTEADILMKISADELARDTLVRLGVPNVEMLAHMALFRRLAELDAIDFKPA